MNTLQNLQKRATKLLEQWAAAAEEHWHPARHDATQGCYGPGYKHWGVQSNWNYAAAMATLGAQPKAKHRAKWQQRAVAATRFGLATHVSGGQPGNDGTLWGNTWISMLGIERAMHGITRIADALPPADRDALRRLLVNEADWLLLHAAQEPTKGVVAGMWASSRCNKPESNIWSGCLLWRVANLYPEEPHAAEWKELAHRYLMNGVSVEADARDTTRVAGRPVSEWHIGANFFPHYALDHHGYMNVGYMAICVSNAAILHFDFKRAGLQPPASLYHHEKDLWQVLRRMVFADGRLARIGGDSRVRYAYCQEYLLPSLLFAADCFRDPHALGLLERQLAWIEQEAEANADGTFYGRRTAALRRENPHYYTRMESDRACVLAMLLNYLPLVEVPSEPASTFEESVAGPWIEEAHGAVLHRSPTRLSSFAWRAQGLTQALCLPPGDSSLAEWALNLCPVVQFLGDNGEYHWAHRRLLANRIASFDGGFVTSGSVMEGVNAAIDEGGACTDQAVTHIAFAALPDGQTCLSLQYVVAAADRLAYLSELRDLHLVVPNDIFNGSRRTLRSAGRAAVLSSPPKRDEVVAFKGNWISIDDRLGVVVLHGGNGILVDRSASRRAGFYRSLFTEEICLHVRRGVACCRPGEILTDIGFAVLAGATAQSTARVKGGAIPFPQTGVRGIWVNGLDGKRYALVANFSAQAQTVDVAGESLELAAGAAVVRTLPFNEPAERTGRRQARTRIGRSGKK